MAVPLEELQRRLGLYPPPQYKPLYVGKGRSKRWQRAMGKAAARPSRRVLAEEQGPCSPKP
jgi:hypothetical protein